MDDRTDAPEEQPLAALASPPDRRTRRRALWGALAVLAVGAGSLAVSGIDDATPPRLPISLGSSGERAAGGATPAAADMATSMPGYLHYVAGDDLPLLGGEAPAYRLPAKVSADAVRAVAEALHLDAEPTYENEMWHVRSGTASLDATGSGGGSWWFSANTVGYDDVAKGAAGSPGVGDASTSSGGGSTGSSSCPPDAAAADACSSVRIDPVTPVDPVTPTTLYDRDTSVCGPVEKCAPPIDPPPFVPPADLPTRDEARTIALDLFQATSIDVDGAEVQVDGPYDGWSVSIQPRLDGLLVSGRFLSVTVGPHGAILYASGSFPGEERLGSYPTLDTRGAIDRLNDGSAFLADGVARAAEGSGSAPASDLPVTTTILGEPPIDPVRPAIGCAEVVPDLPVVPTVATVPGGGQVPPYSPCDPGPYVPPTPVDVVLHGAERILTLSYANDGTTDVYLVPGYRFSGDEGVTAEVPAVDDDSLLPAPPHPGPVETPLPADVGGSTTVPCYSPPPGPGGAVPDICLASPVTADPPTSTTAKVPAG